MGYLYRVIIQYNYFFKYNKRERERERERENYCLMSNSGEGANDMHECFEESCGKRGTGRALWELGV